MNNNTYITFKKQRELGDILTDTFAFIRTEFKPFGKVFLTIVGPYLVVMMISLALYLYFVGNQFNFLVEQSETAINGLLTAAILILYFLSFIMVYIMSQSTVLHYIKSYIEGKGETNFDSIRADVYAALGSFLGLGFIVIACLVIGFMFCLIPGIYLWVPLSLSFSIMAFERKGISDAFGDSFSLVKDHWWISFATLLVVAIIVTVASYAFALPTAIYGWAKMGILSGALDAESMMDSFKDPIYILLNMIGTLAQFVLNIITLVAGAFLYFNLNERKNFSGTFERIQNLGQNPEN
tara:strand:- start:1623 stop:2507 length:885 start_codon:yes stop_codon:yes gene_type:complete